MPTSYLFIMEAQAYLLKEKLFTFNLPHYNADLCKDINLDHVFEESCILPMDQFKDTDTLLTTKLKEAISDKSQSNRYQITSIIFQVISAYRPMIKEAKLNSYFVVLIICSFKTHQLQGISDKIIWIRKSTTRAFIH